MGFQQSRRSQGRREGPSSSHKHLDLLHGSATSTRAAIVPHPVQALSSSPPLRFFLFSSCSPLRHLLSSPLPSVPADAMDAAVAAEASGRAVMEARARAPPPSTSVVTCVACRVRLHGPETRRTHYLSDWHRMNIKRKLAGLMPLPADEYARRVDALASAAGGGDAAIREAGGGGNSRGSDDLPPTGVVMTPTGAFCNICSKRFSSTKAAENHLNSRRHIDKARDAEVEGAAGRRSGSGTSAAVDAGAHVGVEANVQEDEDDMELEARLEDGGTPFPPTTCVFDGKACASVEANLAHMASVHGFFMPYIEHLVDAPGLLAYLGEKVGLGYACVACDRPFTSVEAVQRHMVDKAHMRMVDDDERWVDEYAPFFTVDGDEEEEADAAADEEDGEWEEVEDDGEAAELLEAAGLSVKATTTSGVAAVVQLAGGGRAAGRQVVATADAADPPFRGGDDVGEVMDKITSSLVLPNGRVLGHRDLARYYKQRPAPAESRDAAIARRTMRSSVLNNYQRLGWAGPATSKVAAKDQRMQLLRFKRDHLRVGQSNYYTRKAAIRPQLGVLNSGYRP